jgi:Protein of unknown function (DUF6044)
MQRIKFFLRSRLVKILIIAILILLYLSPYLVKGKSAFIPVHDNLNQLNMQGIFDGRMQAKFFPSQNMEDLTLPGTNPIFHLAHLKLDKFFFSLDYFWGFVFNEFFYRILAFLGMYFLLSKYILRNKLSHFQIALISLAFITLPFWPQGNLSIAGIPLLIYAFLNLYHKEKVLLSYLVFLLFPFYSNLFLSGIFLILIMFFVLIYLSFKKKMNLYLAAAYISFLLCYAFSHYPVFLNEFIFQIPTNRSDQVLTGFNFWDTINLMGYNFFKSYKLAPSLHAFLILPSSLIITFLIFLKKRKLPKAITILWISVFLLPILYGLFYWNPLLNIYNKFQFGFRYDRLYVLSPVLWFFLWSICLGWLSELFQNRTIKYVIMLILIMQLGLNYYSYTYRAFSKNPSYQEFMAGAQFDEIRNNLPEKDNNFRIGCIGFYPAVANFNGFKTVGSFSAYYPLEFKNRFRKIIEKELEQNSELSTYFENKGSALFLFDNEIGTHYSDQEYLKQNLEKITCDLDMVELKKFGVKYLFSTVEIENAIQRNLTEIYQSKNSDCYRMFVYKM